MIIKCGSRKMLRKYRSCGGKSQAPSYKGAMAEFRGWLGLHRSGCYIIFAVCRESFPSAQAMYNSASKVFM